MELGIDENEIFLSDYTPNTKRIRRKARRRRREKLLGDFEPVALDQANDRERAFERLPFRLPFPAGFARAVRPDDPGASTLS